ncbi:hypothetical protein K503DRAFT_768701 [Rhizopogon vinicolor AM-OR11-026]|uniref:Uncharacterized protein n=1 Tax=Rhizopogon vinicolor AM-OR11-026 TaxID=1314800 RepID=A0A1B7N669_9AGAM|nr:hypothetical protein K503DRAFT_768701 [Rhizopogon vinicolor AM-OR11-026]
MTPQKNWKLIAGAVPNLESQVDDNSAFIFPSMPLSPTTNDFLRPYPTVTLGPRHHHNAPPFREPCISHNPGSSTGHNCHNTTQEQLVTEYSNGHASQSPQFSSQYVRTNQTMDFFGPKMSTSVFPPASNDSPNQWQNPVIPQPRPLTYQPLPPTVPPPSIVESPQFRLPSHGSGHIYCPSFEPPTNQQYPTPILSYINPPHHLRQLEQYRVPGGSQSHSFSPPSFSCQWLLADTPCGFSGTLKELKAHCKKGHFFGPNNARIECRWHGCNYHKRDDCTMHDMRRDCMWRHIYEVHLGMKRVAL